MSYYPIEDLKKLGNIFGNTLVNDKIWPKPIDIPNVPLGLDGCHIDPMYIPYDCRKLVKDATIIINNKGERLFYNSSGMFVFLNNNPSVYLSEWFCKWTPLLLKGTSR